MDTTQYYVRTGMAPIRAPQCAGRRTSYGQDFEGMPSILARKQQEEEEEQEEEEGAGKASSAAQPSASELIARYNRNKTSEHSESTTSKDVTGDTDTVATKASRDTATEDDGDDENNVDINSYFHETRQSIFYEEEDALAGLFNVISVDDGNAEAEDTCTGSAEEEEATTTATGGGGGEEREGHPTLHNQDANKPSSSTSYAGIGLGRESFSRETASVPRQQTTSHMSRPGDARNASLGVDMELASRLCEQAKIRNASKPERRRGPSIFGRAKR